MSEFHGCEICGYRAKWRFSPDLDIRGLGACQKHLEIVRQGYGILLSLGIEEYKAYRKVEIEKEKKRIKEKYAIKSPGDNPPKKRTRISGR